MSEGLFLILSYTAQTLFNHQNREHAQDTTVFICPCINPDQPSWGTHTYVQLIYRNIGWAWRWGKPSSAMGKCCKASFKTSIHKTQTPPFCLQVKARPLHIAGWHAPALCEALRKHIDSRVSGIIWGMKSGPVCFPIFDGV